MAVAFVIFGPDMAEWGDRCGQVFVRVAKNQDKIEAKRRIAEVLNRLDGSQKYEMWFLDDDLQQTYVEEFRFISQVKLFAIICIIITIIGVFSLTMFETEYRRKEIAIRKVFGSTSRQIHIRLLRTFMLYVVVAFVPAVLLIHHFMTDWLSTYSYRIDLAWWIYLVAGLFCLVVSLIAVMTQSYKAAN